MSKLDLEIEEIQSYLENKGIKVTLQKNNPIILNCKVENKNFILKKNANSKDYIFEISANINDVLNIIDNI